MRTVGNSIALIAALTATQLMSACGRDRSAVTSSTNANQTEAPPAIRYQDHVWAGGLPPPGVDLSNPQTATAESLKDGQALFSAMNCDGCHSGDGSGAVGPSLIDGRWRYGGQDDEIFGSIFYGRPKGMPAYGGVLGQGGVWLLVNYLKSLPRLDSVPTLSWSEPQSGEARPGREGATGASTQ